MSDTDHLQMIYPEFVDQAMRSQEPVTRVRESGERRRIYEAAQYDAEHEIVWRCDISADHYSDYETTPRVHFNKCYPTASNKYMQKWSSLATGRLSGPQRLQPWESLFVVFNAALGLYKSEHGTESVQDGESA